MYYLTMGGAIYFFDATITFRRVIFKSRFGNVIANLRTIIIPIPLLYLLISFLNFRLRNLDLKVTRRYLFRLYLHELKEELRNSPLRLIMNLAFLCFVRSNQRFQQEVHLFSRHSVQISSCIQPKVMKMPNLLLDVGPAHEKSRLLFILTSFNRNEIYPKFSDLIAAKKITSVNKVLESNLLIQFENFQNVLLIDNKSFLDENGDLISTTPFEVEDYSGLPIRGVVRHGNSNIMMAHDQKTLNFEIPVVFFGYSHNPRNYYHFIVEILPRIMKYKELSSRPIRALVYHDTPMQILDVYYKSLGLAPILITDTRSPKKYHKVTITRDYRHTKLVDFKDSILNGNCFSSRALELHDSKAYLESLFHSITESRIKVHEFATVFLTRNSFLARVPTNILDLENCMTALGVRVVDTSYLSISEQITIFKTAKLIISLSGASLTNLMFCGKDTKVLMIPPDLSQFSFVFWRDFAQIFGVELNVMDSVFRDGVNPSKYFVDVKQFQKIVSNQMGLS